MKWLKLALQKKMIFTPLKISIRAQWKKIKSCYPIVSLIVYRRAIKQLMPLKEENSRLSKTLKTLQVIWRASNDLRWPSSDLLNPIQISDDLTQYDWWENDWGDSLKDSSGFWRTRRPSWRISSVISWRRSGTD